MEEKTTTTTYQPQDVEKKWYDFWRQNGFFSSDLNPDGDPFCIVMPPPNVTGQLHMGHALDNTLQDVLTRWRRMQGRRALWLPGCDHAGIATQAKVEEALAKEGISRHDIGREAFLEKAWEWKHIYHDRITRQLATLGSSCDWDHERFTLDEGCSRAVRQTFVSLYNKGLIYRGSYITNWCSHCQTTISDIEVEHKDRPSHLWHLRYPFADGSGYIVVATTRPETIPGDMAVAVNPADERYAGQIGKMITLPMMGREIPLIADDYCDIEFGTGAVKITPSHDPNDFEVSLRHNLPQLSVIGRDGLMNENAGDYAGMTMQECRERIVEQFRAAGLLEKITELNHAVGECYRCGTPVEPLVSPQWFVKMAPLAKPAIEAVTSGQTKFVPERFTKIYTNWMENIRDWCISRQLWWGHRIPVWYCADCGAEICTVDDPDTCPKCGSHHLDQDPDVLDTWFSSALWPFSTLGWPEQTKLLHDFYPTNVLVTGYDIIFFWVSRMIFSGIEQMKQTPFGTVFIHGLVRDEQGRKMSKSLGNGIDPLEVIDKYGADSLRYSLIAGVTPGNDLRFQWERVESARNFMNKLWNACRFTNLNTEDYTPGQFAQPELTLADKWILTRLSQVAEEVNVNLEKYELGEALRGVYDFAWDEFCDWYVELVKPRLYNADGCSRYTAQYVLTTVLRGVLELLHPFCPFITEELWQRLPHDGTSIMAAHYPESTVCERYPKEADQMAAVMDIIRAVRNLRAEMNVPLGKKATLVLRGDAADTDSVKPAADYIRQLAHISELTLAAPDHATPEQAAKTHLHGLDVFMPLADLIDLDKETARIEREISQTQGEIKRLTGKLDNPGFTEKAPAAVVEKEREKLTGYESKLVSLAEHLQRLRGNTGSQA